MGELKSLLEKLKREQPPAFGNADYEVRLTHTVDTDMRIMSFVDTMWEFEVSGGVDQFEPLTIISVKKKKAMDPEGNVCLTDSVTRVANLKAFSLLLLCVCVLVDQGWSGRSGWDASERHDITN